MIEGVAPRRLFATRMAVLLGAFAVFVVEAAGALHALNRTVVAGAWVLALLVLVVELRPRRRGQHSVPVPPAHLPGQLTRGTTALVRAWWASVGRIERFMAVAIGALLSAEFVVAVLAEPNNFDSQTYHLPRIEHWVAAGSVDFSPTAIHRQVTLAPGGEYLLTHLRLLTGSDVAYNLVQWAMGVLCVFVASRIAAQFGGSRRAQLITAFIVAATPMVTLQASSTQVDLIVAGWAAALATFVLDGMRTPVTARMVAWLGLAAGLAVVTKATGVIAAAALLLLWGLAQLRMTPTWRGVTAVVAGSLGVLVVAGLLAGPFLTRIYTEFGSILGPSRVSNSIPMQRHDPASILVNALRIGHTALDTPLSPLRRVSADAIASIASVVGVDPDDPDITFFSTTFPVPAWYPDEDRVAQPIQGMLILLAAGFCFIRPRRFTSSPGVLRAYVVTFASAALLYVSTVKWQPWGNRLTLFLIVLGAPLAGLWLDQVMRRRWPGRAVVVTLLVAATSATLAVGYGVPRRLVGQGSVFTTDALDTRFLRRPDWKNDFVAVSEAIAASGARRIGIVQQNNNWEYPWWVLLPGREFVALQSEFPGIPPERVASVDAIVCTGDMKVCQRYVPAGWPLVTHGYAAYARPPAR